jgi:hypothetical protein
LKGIPSSIFLIEKRNDCKIELLSRFTIGMDKGDRTNETAGNNQIEEENSDTNKDIKKRMDEYEAKIKAGGEAPEGDATRYDE